MDKKEYGIIIGMKIGFYTLGCKVNQYETEAMKEKFVARGYEILQDGDSPADVYIINTCTVTNLADRKSRQFIRRAKSYNEDALIAVTGCYAQVDPEAVSKIEGVDVIAGTNEKRDIVSFVEDALSKKCEDRQAKDMAESNQSIMSHILTYDQLDEYRSDGIIRAMDTRTRAFVKIQEGCNRFCSYCIIPYARGPVRSRDEEEIVEEVRGLVSYGFKEVVLTGINTALYGAEREKKDSEGIGLKSLLYRLDSLEGDFRIRLSSLEPTVVGLNDVESILDSKRLCNHLHLSVQSGANNVLRLMNRRYTREDYLSIVDMLRSRDPYFGITTDIIVGFPGETEEDFADSLDLIRTAGLSRVHVFKYSPRKGTKAADMPNQIHPEEKTRRARIMAEEAKLAAKKFNESQRGTTTRILIEEKTTDGRYLTGYSDNYTRVYIPHIDKNLLNMLIYGKIYGICRDGVKGDLTDG